MHQQHVGALLVRLQLEILAGPIAEHDRRKRTKRLAELDLQVHHLLHVTAPRIAEDAACAVQSSLRGGVLPGGGAAEIGALSAVQECRALASGMTAYGLDCVLEALKQPLAQIVANAGYNPLEKVEEVLAMASRNPAVALDCDTGQVADMYERGVVDAAPVKVHALQAAGEIACA